MGNSSANFIVGLVVGFAFGMIPADIINLGISKTNLQIISKGCAHYDAHTGAFTWNLPEKSL